MTDPAFTKILREHLKYLAADEPLDPAAPLRTLGLDSMAAVTLTVELEDEFDVTLPDSELTPATFASAATLWAVVDRARDRRAG